MWDYTIGDFWHTTNHEDQNIFEISNIIQLTRIMKIFEKTKNTSYKDYEDIWEDKHNTSYKDYEDIWEDNIIQLTRTMNIFEKTKNTIYSGIGKDENVVRTKINFKDIKYSCNMSLPCFINFFIGCKLNTHTAQGSKQWTPSWLQFSCASLH